MKTQQPWLFEAPSSQIKPPEIPEGGLLYNVSTPKNLTLYVKITLGGESPAQRMTGIFIPQNYRIPSQIDLVVYLHGHHKDNNYPTNLSIDQYWGAKYPHFRLRESLNVSQKNVILVAPTLGPGAQAGWLTSDPNGFEKYLDQVRAALIAHYAPFKDLKDPPSIGEIVLACHSGGGIEMQRIVMNPQKYISNIRECWGFDCLYGNTNLQSWIDWVKTHKAKLFIHYGNGGTAENSEKLRKMASAQKVPDNVLRVDGLSTLDHNHVPITYWHNRLRAARFLLGR